MNNILKVTPVVTPRRGKRALPSCTDSSKKRKLNKTESVQVFCRLKPLKYSENNCIIIRSSTEVTLRAPSGAKVIHKDAHFVFKDVFTPHADQLKLFQNVALPILEDLLKGKNGLLFAYGVTGSGKTYTLQGKKI